MRAGKLTNTITIERLVETPDDYGVLRPTWTPIATVRAQIVQASTEEFLRTAGQAAEAAIIFRVRFIEGVTPADRIAFDARHLNIKETKEIGQRRGLEIRVSGGYGS